MQEGYKLHEIDQMDIKFFFDLHMIETKYVTADELSWL